jgi:hypothetical protein
MPFSSRTIWLIAVNLGALTGAAEGMQRRSMHPDDAAQHAYRSPATINPAPKMRSRARSPRLLRYRRIRIFGAHPNFSFGSQNKPGLATTALTIELFRALLPLPDSLRSKHPKDFGVGQCNVIPISFAPDKLT